MQPKFEVVDFAPTTLIGLEADFYGGMSPKFNGQEVLGPLWGKVHGKLAALGLAFSGRMIAATRPAASGEDGLLTQFVGLEVATLPADLDGLEVYRVPALRLATLEHYGSMAGLVGSIHKLYENYIPEAGLKQPTPWALELEIYDQRFDLEREDSIMLIGAPVL